MRAVLQRVSKASVSVNDLVVGEINHGILVLLGVAENDTTDDAQWLCAKIAGMRIFNDQDGKMNCSILETGGDILVISQFTLFASIKKGNRPSFMASAKPEIAIPLYENVLLQLSSILGKPIQSGQFGAHMNVHLVNDGPVTIIIDSKTKE